MSEHKLTRGEFGNEARPVPGAYFGEDSDNPAITEPGQSFDGWHPVSQADATGMVVFDQDFGWMHWND